MRTKDENDTDGRMKHASLGVGFIKDDINTLEE